MSIRTEGISGPGAIDVRDARLEVILTIRRVLPLRRIGNND